jgi:hypothetical protein
VQGVVDGAIDRVIDWIVAQANRLFRGNREDNRNQQNPQQDAQVTRGLEALSSQERPFLDSGKITEQEAQQVATNVKSQHPVFRELRVVDGGDSWDYQYDAGERHRGRKNTAISQTPESGRVVIQRASKKIKNKEEGDRREKEELDELKLNNPDAKVQKERYLRDKNGKIVKDPLTGEGRRIDIVVIENDDVKEVIEVTSETADKAEQIAKEKRIRKKGGTFIRDKETRELIDISKKSTKIKRRK